MGIDFSVGQGATRKDPRPHAQSATRPAALWLRPSVLYVRRFGVHAAWLGVLLVGSGLIVWILVQMTTLRFHLQPPFLALGVGIVVVSALPAVRHHLNANPVHETGGGSL